MVRGSMLFGSSLIDFLLLFAGVQKTKHAVVKRPLPRNIALKSHMPSNGPTSGEKQMVVVIQVPDRANVEGRALVHITIQLATK